MNTETEFKNDWRLMFNEDNLDGLVALNVEQFRQECIEHCDFPFFMPQDRESFDQGFVCDVFSDFLLTCGCSQAHGTRFSRAELKDAMKEMGVPSKDIRHDSTELSIRLKNATYVVSLDCGAQVKLGGKGSTPSRGYIKVGFLGSRGFADFIMKFDEVVPGLRERMDELYMEIREYNDGQRAKESKVGKMLQIALNGKGVDYEYELVGDKVRLKLERIVYTRVEKEVDFDKLADYLGRVPEILQTVTPKVTKGCHISMFPEPVSFGSSRDKVYDRLGRGSQEDITGK